MIIRLFQRIKILRNIVTVIERRRARILLRNIVPGLNKTDRILDIGAGDCLLAETLIKEGYTVTPLDVENKSFADGIAPVVYDGSRIPFEDTSFDVAIIVTVLHHTPVPEDVLVEAKRVAGRIIVTEDVYEGVIHQYATYFFDSLLNLEFIGHPHTNKRDKEWRAAFAQMGLRLTDVKFGWMYVFRHATYYLTR